MTSPEKSFTTLKSGHLLLRMGRIWNFIRIEFQIEYNRNFEYESNIETNMNIEWLLIRLEYNRDVLPGGGVITWPRAMFLFNL